MKKKHSTTSWHKLDNTANVFPIVTSRRMTNVFRISAVLNDTVDVQNLQLAVEQTLPYFRAFKARLRHGLFWSYFESNDAAVKIEAELEAPCRYIDPVETNRYLFRVMYFENRIHLEVFHALTDGTGALRFLKAICYAYIKLANPEAFSEQQLNKIYGIEGADNIEDAYVKNYVPKKTRSYREKTAYIVKGEYRSPDNIGVLTALINVSELKEICKKYDASITEYLTALLAFGVYKEHMGLRGSKKPVNLFVLVDLRRIFKTDTSVNFFSNIVVSLLFSKNLKTFEEVIAQVKECFKDSITRDYFEKKLSYTVRSETNLFTRIIPLPVKRGILRIIYEHSNHGSTMPFSNLGIVACEEEFAPFIEGFRVLLYASEHDAIKCAAITSNGTLALCFTTFLEGFKLPRFVVRELTAQGARIELESNGEENEIL